MNSDDNIYGPLCSTELTECRRMLRQTREEADAERSHRNLFFAAANHDLRQPFQAIRLLYHVLLERAARHDDQVMNRALDNLGLALASGEELLSALLDVGAIETGNLTPASTVVAISSVLSDLELTFHGLAEQKNINLTVNTCGASVYSDPNLLRRIVWNLIDNAIKYTDCGDVTVSCDEKDGFEIFQVQDTGIGIAIDKQRLIFEEFYQVGNIARDRTKGLGLGLSIVRRLCRILDHDIEMRSEPGVGTTFSVKLRRVT